MADLLVFALTTSLVEFTCSVQVRHVAGTLCVFRVIVDAGKGKAHVTKK